MPSFFKSFLFVITFALIFNACTSTQEVSDAPPPGKEDSTTESVFPGWYSSQINFDSDSLTYHGFAEAVSGDSVVAMANAELQARANLERGISDLLEDIRVEIQESGTEAVSEPEFLIAFRRAHQQVETQADAALRESRSTDSYSKGYARVSISRSELLALLEDNLSAIQWNLISSAPQFSEELD